MLEIFKSNDKNLTSLYLSGGSEFPIIRAVIESQQEGRVFVDRESEPTSCIVFSKFGFTYFFGDNNNSGFNSSIASLICTKSILNMNYLLWYKPPICWINKFKKYSETLFKRRERIRYKFNISLFNEENAQFIISGYKVKQIDKNLIKKMEHFLIDFPTRFWRSADDFLENGFGFCMIYEKAVVGICYTACISGGLAEIDVATIEDHREKKIGRILTHIFITYCIKNNIEPTWDCFSYYEPSKRIAEAMGFVEKERYPFYSFIRPIKQPDILAEMLTWD